VGRAGFGALTVTFGGPSVAGTGHATITGSGHAWLGGGRLLEVVTDQLALLGQELVEVLVHVLLADRFRGQVQILELLELAGPGLLRCLMAVVPGPAWRTLLRLGGRLLADRTSRRTGGQQRLERAAGLFMLRSGILGQQVIPVRGVVRGRSPWR
jgi:hypothetical protein